MAAGGRPGGHSCCAMQVLTRRPAGKTPSRIIFLSSKFDAALATHKGAQQYWRRGIMQTPDRYSLRGVPQGLMELLGRAAHSVLDSGWNFGAYAVAKTERMGAILAAAVVGGTEVSRRCLGVT